MAYITASDLDRTVVADFDRGGRLGLLSGAMALGALGGTVAAFTLGRVEPWLAMTMATPFLALALYLTSAALRDCMARKSYACATAVGLNISMLLAWPIAGAFIPTASALYFVLPALALGTLFMFASCWSGSARAVYRLAAQGALIAVVVAQQGVMVVMG